jgi:ELWxxDGT repeat protein
MAAFPELVRDIVPGLQGSFPDNLTVFNDKLYFSAFTSSSGQELWVSDGTAAGTQLVKDINPVSVGSFGVGSSSPRDFFVFNGKLFFTADDGSTGQELWSSDGTTAGTQLVKDIRPGLGSSTESPFYSPADFAVFNGRLFFSANDGSTGRELWSTDGTTAGTQLFKDILPGINGSNPTGMTVFNGKLFFAAIDPIAGYELWSSDGTAAGTQLLKDIFPRGGFGSSPANFTVFDNKLFFTANDFDNTGDELWVTDGTTAGTRLFKDINPGGFGSSPQSLTVVNGKLFFNAQDANGYEVWVTDGTAAGTQLTKNIYTGPSAYSPRSLTAFNGKLFFVAEDATSGSEVWFSDGTAAGTQLLKDIAPGTFGSSPTALAIFDGKLFITIARGDLWESDGTTAGTQLLADIFFSESTSRPQNFTVLGNQLLFSAGTLNSGSRVGTGVELWKIAATTPSLTIAPTNADQLEGNTGPTPLTFTITRSGNTSTASSVS